MPSEDTKWLIDRGLVVGAEADECARPGCGHVRARHIDRASLPDSIEPCDEDGCSCVEFIPPGRWAPS